MKFVRCGANLCNIYERLIFLILKSSLINRYSALLKFVLSFFLFNESLRGFNALFPFFVILSMDNVHFPMFISYCQLKADFFLWFSIILIWRIQTNLNFILIKIKMKKHVHNGWTFKKNSPELIKSEVKTTKKIQI